MSVDTRHAFRDAPLQPSPNPMTAVYGIRDGRQCGDCVFFRRAFGGRKYHKCEKRGITHGAGTDHRVRWPACGLFEPACATCQGLGFTIEHGRPYSKGVVGTSDRCVTCTVCGGTKRATTSEGR